MPPDDSLDRPIVPFWLALLLAVGGAIAIETGFPDKDVWLLTPFGIAAVLIALIGRRFSVALLIGFVAGITFWLVHIAWLTLYLGPIPWLALAFLESVFFALGSAAIAVVYSRASRTWGTGTARRVVLPVVVAGLWTGRESLTAVFPEGGFAWGRIATAQSSSPLAPLVAWVGFAGLTFLVVWLVAFAIEVVRSDIRVVARATAVVAAVAALLVIPAWPAPTEGTLRVGAVQGNSRAGLFDHGAPGDILSDHVSGSLTLVDEDLDLLVWPENASDLNPERYAQAADALDFVVDAVDAPLAVGTIALRGDNVYNTSLLWEKDGSIGDFYDKRHPVPFAEYMPLRPVFRAIVPDLVDLVTRDYTKGTTDAIFTVNGVRAGVTICFDIVDDALNREIVADGAQLLLAQTNNADFGRTDENLQQLAIARMRAIETGRSVVNISTVGTSQIIGPDGATINEIPAYEPGTMVADVPLATINTPAFYVGRGLELLVAGLGLAGLGLALTAGGTRRARGREPRRVPTA